MFTALLVPFVAGSHGGGAGAVGALLSALGVGYLAGSAVARWAVDRYSPRVLLAAGQAGVGACFLTFALAPDLVVALVALGLAGLPGATLLVTIETQIQRCTPDPLRGRTAAVFAAGDAAAALLGAATATVLALVVPVVMLLAVTAASMVLCAVIVRWLMPAGRVSA